MSYEGRFDWYKARDVIIFIFSIGGLFLAVMQIFNWWSILFDFVIMDKSYYYLAIMIFLPLKFISVSPNKNNIRSFYNISLALICIICGFYMTYNSFRMMSEGWEFIAPWTPTILCILFWFVIIEGARKATGIPLMAVVLFFSFFPIFTGHLFGFLQGQEFSFLQTARYHIMSSQGIVGIPTAVFGSLIVGFLVYGVALQEAGGGEFFLNLASSLFGWARGGAAKVSILGSALFGSLSGSVISNVLTTGSMTIPTMKRAGYPSEFACAIEACASTGGVLMPPIMGATAFIMASFLGIPYFQICFAAAIPSVLYYFGLFIQVDAFAARVKLKGMSRTDLPSIIETFKDGWPYILSFIILIYFLFFMRKEAQAPFIATGVLLAVSFLRKKKRFTLKKMYTFICSTGRLLSEIIAILAAIGFILSALSVTGVANSFSREIVVFAGGNIAVLLILGALTSFVLGMGMTVTACYVFLAIVLAPALTTIGLNPMAVHLFIMYWGCLSYITPPVAIAAFAAAPLANANPLKVGTKAMQLGFVKFIIPFFFVLEPALVFQGNFSEIIYSFITAIVGVYIIGGALEGYFLGIGRISLVLRTISFFGGILMVFPSWKTDLIGLAIATLVMVASKVLKKTTSSVE